MEILEGKFHVMHQDPKAIHEANKTIFLTLMSVVMMVPIGHLSFIFGTWIGSFYTS